MANEEQLSILKQGDRVWNKWREDNPNVKIDLSFCNFLEHVLFNYNFSAANLTKATFRKAYLKGADFSGADLTAADLLEADLFQANFSNADLSGADLSHTNLYNANFTKCDLYGVNFDGAYLEGANFTGARVWETIFAFVDLTQIINLESVVHGGPSNVGVETLRRSIGNIPSIFLKGCGLRDLDIEYAKLANPNLDSGQVTDITYRIHQLYLGGGVQYYSCFISYSSKDQEFAQRLHNDLQNNGVRCWFDREDLKIGDSIRPMIDRQIRLRDKLLVILSENSIKSEWVGDEVEAALEEESKNSRLVLFPIRLDETVINARDDWAAKIKRRRHIGDFSNWRDKSSYQKSFERLLRDLKATE